MRTGTSSRTPTSRCLSWHVLIRICLHKDTLLTDYCTKLRPCIIFLSLLLLFFLDRHSYLDLLCTVLSCFKLGCVRQIPGLARMPVCLHSLVQENLPTVWLKSSSLRAQRPIRTHNRPAIFLIGQCLQCPIALPALDAGNTPVMVDVPLEANWSG